MNSLPIGETSPRLQYGLAIFAILLATTGSALFLMFGLVSLFHLLLGASALVGAAFLLWYPEIALAGLLIIGTMKGNPALADSPIDLTVALLVLTVVGGVLKSGKDLFALRIVYPKSYALYLAFIGIMLLSLTYTADYSAGLDKVGRFIVFSGAVIVMPFLVLRTRDSLTRFFLTLVAGGLIVSFDSFGSLGGKERLVSSGGDTIQLGHDAATAIIVIWYLLLPGKRLVKRAILYALVLALAVAMLGSGSRGPVVGLGCCLALSFVLHKRLGIQGKSMLLDLGAVTLAGLMVIPFVGIPQSSFDYLARLGDPNMHHMLGPREALMDLAWHLTLAHPLRGVGIGGYPVLFRGIGAWPHNMFLEISSELGVFAVVLFVMLLWVGFREALREVMDRDPQYGPLAAMVFAFFVLQVIDIINTGSLNDNRAMWLAIALPFVLKNMRAEESAAVSAYRPWRMGASRATRTPEALEVAGFETCPR
jgi:O-antigen ligase